MKRIDEINRIDSCLNKAGDLEPIFVLRANDELASEIVRVWASRYKVQKMGENFDSTGSAALTEKQLEKYNEARALANWMDTYRENQQEAARRSGK